MSGEPPRALPVKAIVASALVLGITAALVAWWLERFQSERLHAEVQEYLGRYDEFRDWLRTQPGKPSEGEQ